MVWKNKFHERINELWKRAKEKKSKMTQTEYARRLGVTRNALLGWLRGSGQPDVDGLVRIASTENVSLAWLMGDERPRKENELLQDEQTLLYSFRSISPEHKDYLLWLAIRWKEAEECASE
ncbi:helix-turn-helix transcriptional regulator [Selenomonas sp. AB3002]|uniref:helix-turn-helix domain-containing protein n=1 Tax=Selenomonas sp. AB3002 TaxID=1392502 RepID=UPI00068E7571